MGMGKTRSTEQRAPAWESSRGCTDKVRGLEHKPETEERAPMGTCATAVLPPTPR